jgi:hypothetical protein
MCAVLSGFPFARLARRWDLRLRAWRDVFSICALGATLGFTFARLARRWDLRLRA